MTTGNFSLSPLTTSVRFSVRCLQPKRKRMLVEILIELVQFANKKNYHLVLPKLKIVGAQLEPWNFEGAWQFVFVKRTCFFFLQQTNLKRCGWDRKSCEPTDSVLWSKKPSFEKNYVIFFSSTCLSSSSSWRSSSFSTSRSHNSALSRSVWKGNTVERQKARPRDRFSPRLLTVHTVHTVHTVLTVFAGLCHGHSRHRCAISIRERKKEW